ncbi:MAG: prepilin-type N-terminal cleavage/methylation domain-containing protein [Planctomycetes bacterium]|nr:prepilin-type N-terminal cleavage/methylation domain-containing protein [Planctomycetota bacterium]
MTTHRRTIRVAGARAFTLMEVLAAITIFALGAVSIITMFPVAAKMQAETMDDIMSQMVMRSAEAYLKARPLNMTFLNQGAPIGPYTDNFAGTVYYSYYRITDLATSTSVLRMPTRMTDAANGNVLCVGWLEPLEAVNLAALSAGDKTTGLITLRDRSFPTSKTVGRHDYTWVPVVRRTTLAQNLAPLAAFAPALSSQWEVYIFVLKNIDAGKGDAVSGNKTFTLRTGQLSADDLAQPIVVRGAGASGDDLVTLVESSSATTITLLNQALTTSKFALYQLPGRLRNAAITRSTSDLTRFNFTSYLNNANPPGVVGGQQILANNGVIFNVTRADTTGFNISGLVLPDAQGKYPESVWFGANGTQQLFRLDGSDVVK